MYADVNEKENYKNSSPNTKKKIIIKGKIKKLSNFSDNVYQTGRTSYILYPLYIKNVKSKPLLIKKTAQELKKEYNNSQAKSSSLGEKLYS